MRLSFFLSIDCQMQHRFLIASIDDEEVEETRSQLTCHPHGNMAISNRSVVYYTPLVVKGLNEHFTPFLSLDLKNFSVIRKSVQNMTGVEISVSFEAL